MSKVLLKLTCVIPRDEVDRIEAQINDDLKENGFAIVPPIFEVYEIDGKEVE